MQARPVSRRWRFRTSWALTGLAALAAVAFGIYLSLSLSQPSAALPEGLPFAAVSPQPVPQLEFLDGESHARSLAEFRGKLVVLNIWATWCKPCREEMPALDRLQAALGDADVQVVALSIDREGVPIVRKYYDEVGIKALPLYVDPSGQAGFKLATVGVPTTLLVDREGREVGRHVGPAKWDAPEAIEALRRLALTRNPER